MKKILILYADNGDIRNIYKKELMWNKVIELVTKGSNELRQVETSVSQKSRYAIFADGTTVWMIPIGSQIRGVHATHAFVSEEIYNLRNGQEYVRECLMPTLYLGGKYDTDGKSAKERLFVFKTNDNNEVELEEFKFHLDK